MRTSLNNIQRIEQFLSGKLKGVAGLLLEARLLTEPDFRKDVFLQKKLFHLVKIFHRRKLKEDAEKVHHQIFNDPSKADFQKKILQLFNS